MHHTPIAAGGSSFERIDSEKLFAEIQLKPGMTFLDIACGYGYYSNTAVNYVGNTGMVYAVDLWKDGIEHLSHHIKDSQVSNILPVLADARNMIPVKSATIGICLLATVLHDFILEKTADGVLKEIHRVLKPAGRFAVIEFKKTVSKPGPPVEIRMTPEQVEKKVSPYGFDFLKTVVIGKFHYLSLFEKLRE